MKLAAIAATYNEPDFLSQFVDYYEKQVDAIYLIDNDSTDDSVEIVSSNPKVVVSSYHTSGFDGYAKQQELHKKMAECIGRYDYVLVLDVDEFVVPKEGGTIREALERLPGHPIYGTTGYNMYTFPGDPPFRKSQPFFEQRKRGIQNDHYSKPIVVKPDCGVIYQLGCHYVPNRPPPTLSPFNLLHYKAVDDEVYLKRSLRWAARVKFEKGTYGGGGGYYYNCTADDFRKKLAYEKSSGRVVQVIS